MYEANVIVACVITMSIWGIASFFPFLFDEECYGHKFVVPLCREITEWGEVYWSSYCVLPAKNKCRKIKITIIVCTGRILHPLEKNSQVCFKSNRPKKLKHFAAGKKIQYIIWRIWQAEGEWSNCLFKSILIVVATWRSGYTQKFKTHINAGELCYVRYTVKSW